MNHVIYDGDWSFPVRKDFILNSSISPYSKLLYIALKSYCAPNGNTAFPSSVTLAKAIGISRGTLYKAARELEAINLLTRSQQESTTGRFTHTLWTLRGIKSNE